MGNSITYDMRAFAFQNLEWVLRARGDDETRPFFTRLHVEPGNPGESVLAVCTDGKRLHAAFIPEIAGELVPGEYDVKSSTKTVIVLSRNDDAEAFPPWRRVVPNMAEHTVTIEGFRAGPGKYARGDAMGKLYHRIHTLTGVPINTWYLEPLMNVGEDWELTVPENHEKAHRFDNCTKMLVVMPMSLRP